MNETKLENMGKRLNDALMNPESAQRILTDLNKELYEAAMKESGVRSDQLMDENMEESPIVRLFWMTLSTLTTKLYLEAANGLYNSKLQRDQA